MAVQQSISAGMSVRTAQPPWRQYAKWTLVALWTVAFAAGLVGMVQRISQGHRPADYGSYLTWGLWVAVYQYLIEMAAGAFIIATAVHVLDLKPLKRMVPAALLLAIASLLAGMVAVWVDLGRMERFWRVILTPNPSSLILWVVIAYGAFTLITAVALWLSVRTALVAESAGPTIRGSVARFLKFGTGNPSAASRRREHRLITALLVMGLVPAVGFAGGEGALFGVVGARPYWNSPVFPIAFLASSVVTAGATLAVLAAFFLSGERNDRRAVLPLAQIAMVGLAALLMLQFADASVSVYASVPAQQDAMDEVLRGDYWWNFWIIQLVVGAAIPYLIFLFRRRSPLWLAMACVLMAAGMMSLRLNAVIPGQIVPQLEGIQAAFVSDRLTFDYFPSAMEWLVTSFVASLAVLIFYVGQFLFPLTADGDSETSTAEGSQRHV